MQRLMALIMFNWNHSAPRCEQIITAFNIILQEDYANGSAAFSQSKLALMLMMNKLSRDLEGK